VISSANGGDGHWLAGRASEIERMLALVRRRHPFVIARRRHEASSPLEGVPRGRVRWPTSPPPCNRTQPICFSPHLYLARNLVERFFNKIKHCRRIATRYDKLPANYLAFVQLASIRLWLRIKDHSGNRQRYATSYQAILDCRRASLVCQELHQHFEITSSLIGRVAASISPKQSDRTSRQSMWMRSAGRTYPVSLHSPVASSRSGHRPYSPERRRSSYLLP
jgi:transposase